eukprot:366052-Chlamydomonas_euryale.AAC.8
MAFARMFGPARCCVCGMAFARIFGPARCCVCGLQDEEELMRELERIKRERAEEAAKKVGLTLTRFWRPLSFPSSPPSAPGAAMPFPFHPHTLQAPTSCRKAFLHPSGSVRLQQGLALQASMLKSCAPRTR